MSQQPRGLPGFLRRTLRNTTYEQDEVLDAPSSDPENADDASGVETSDSVDDVDDIIESGDAVSNERNHVSRVAIDTTERPDDSVGSGKKQLRTVAFPPLLRERRPKNDEIENHTAVKRSTISDASKKLSELVVTQNNDANNTNNDSLINNNPQPPKTYKEIQFESIISTDIIPLRDLRKLSWNGIPTHHRSLCWKILLGYLPANTTRHGSTLSRKRSEYRDARKQHYDIPDDTRTNSEQETLRQVLVDVPRTAPEVPLFHNDRIRRILTRLLYIWAMRHPASSYVQGINDLAIPLIAVFLAGYYEGVNCLDGEIMASVTDEMLEEVEADTYWCLTNLLAGIQDHYTSDQPGIQRMVMRLEELTQRIDVELCTHLKEVGIEFLQFAFKWMNCLLLREFSLSCVIRLWDTYLSEGNGGFEDFHVYVCASFLVHFSSELQQMGFDELFQFMQVRQILFFNTMCLTR